MLCCCWRFRHRSLSDAVVVKADPQPAMSSQELQQAVEQAVQRLQQGGLVAIPTETVYGLAADASNEQAVEKIFSAKGRPADCACGSTINDGSVLSESIGCLV